MLRADFTVRVALCGKYLGWVVWRNSDLESADVYDTALGRGEEAFMDEFSRMSEKFSVCGFATDQCFKLS